ncbi:hypothetical protein LBBP_01109 [Leptospira borgpetersenii serovar Ballum]|uniref:Uncharacterized protein n=1 Tax=Leptospira borgpetersenii serovar Ballum TaxID=280505 RepID=A0A0S2IP81_LEPBO|nr:hypothetical protein LBBP_01109 [Leptospira borgpetersenii serovar Ballum]
MFSKTKFSRKSRPTGVNNGKKSVPKSRDVGTPNGNLTIIKYVRKLVGT